jgi:hypothetical protein
LLPMLNNSIKPVTNKCDSLLSLRSKVYMV